MQRRRRIAAITMGEKMRKVDLHIHSTASDGTWTPQELVNAAQAAGLGLIAVTDHDSTANVAETMRIASANGIKCLPGVEVCSTKDGMSFHILGYGIDTANKPLQELLAHNTYLLEKKDDDSVQLLIKQGWPLDFKEFQNYTYDRRRGGWKSLAYLIDKGLCSGVNDFFKRIFTAENDLGFPEFPPISEVIAAIHGAGGAALCAHAASAFHGPGLAQTLVELIEEPFDGFECYHSGHSEEDTQLLLTHCRVEGMLISGGSDCHGSFVPTRHLGKPDVYETDIFLPGLV